MAKNRAVRTGKAKERFVMLYDFMTNSPAWHDLKGNSVKVLVHLIKMSKGNNGWGDDKRDRGELFLSVRDAAAATGIARNTAASAFQDLIDHGFLRVMRAGHFDVKMQATVWRLTFQPYPKAGMGPTNEWRRWSREQKPQAQKLATSGSKTDHPVSIPEPTAALPEGDRPSPVGSIIAPHIDIYHGGAGEQDARTGSDVACVTEAIRSQVLAYWSTLDGKGKQALATSTGLTVDEVKRYLDGTNILNIGKQMALRRATKEAA